MYRVFFYSMIVSLLIIGCNKEKEDIIPRPDLPESFDLRDEGNFTSIKDQANLGSCWAFACVGLAEYLIKRDYGIEIDLSEQHLVNCAEFGPMGGMNYLTNSGVVIEDDLPYQAQILDCNTELAGEYKLGGFQFLNIKDLSFNERIDSLKQTLVNHGPIVTHMDFYLDLNNYTGGIYEYDGVSASGGGHIILVVGYKDDQSVKNGGYWICRNSWGESWGDKGYLKIPYDECNIAIYYAYIASNAYKVGSFKKLPFNGYHCRWSKDGKKIAYTVRDESSVGIWTYNFDTNDEIQVVSGMEGDMHLSWMDNNGQTIVFDAYNSSNRHDLWKIDITSGVKTKLVDNGNIPDAHSSQDKIVCCYNGNITLFKKNGDFIKNINNISGWNAAISPDGKKIALVSNESGNEDIWIINMDGTSKQQITSFTGRDYWPRWSPDGNMIAFESGRSGNMDVWVYNLKSEKFIQVTNNPATDGIGDWSPDGKSILFISQRGGDWGVYIYYDIF